ncbi:MAG: triose-phosphate isomerase [Crocinitomicaceae bacterium]|nr:triose-phosphate isomerase [Crocinitomicaceae bacterium]
MPKKIVAGNWKMNLNASDANALISALEKKQNTLDVEVMAFPPSLFISGLSKEKIRIGVQNFYSKDKGAYTGEISILQAKSVGASIGLIGHSERRSLFGETNELLKDKVDAALSQGFSFIFCCGEPLEVREAGKENEFVKKQLEESLFHLSEEEMKGCVIAYEPVWAIGTGRTATSEQAENMHKEIRSWIAEEYKKEVAETVSILYGGSCKPSNARELFACPNVDGGLIGGASLNVEDFSSIINSFE